MAGADLPPTDVLILYTLFLFHSSFPQNGFKVIQSQLLNTSSDKQIEHTSFPKEGGPSICAWLYS